MGLQFDIYKISSHSLHPYIQYILFNYAAQPSCPRLITSYANTNICLGIIRDKELYNRADGVKATQVKTGIHAYLSGMYLQPHRFEAAGTLDEICIDFTPLGYYHFFRFPAQTYIFHEDLLTEGFGSGAKHFFERVFEMPDFQKRGAMIESYLLKKVMPMATWAHTGFLRQCLYQIHRAQSEITLRQLANELQCTEKKIARAFVAGFDLTPKDYMRIVRFRKALAYLNGKPGNLTTIGYDSNYYDQSHFIRDFRFFTGKTPGQIKGSLLDVKQNVIIGVE